MSGAGNQPPPPVPPPQGGGGANPPQGGGGGNQPNQPDPNALLAAAITQLTQILAQQQQQQPRAPIYDPYDPTVPFDLGNRVGNEAYNNSKSILSHTWDGTTEKFPEFLIAIRVRAKEAKRDAIAPHGIVQIPTGATNAQGQPITANLFTEYHLLDDQMINNANAARTDPRAVQNARALYHALHSSITGNLRTTILNQSNSPTDEDGVRFFVSLLRFTELSSMTLSFNSIDKLMRLDPADYDFVIPDINQALCQLILLATTPQRPFPEPEQIQHAITAYQRIKQPELWAHWVRDQMEQHQRGALTSIQSFLNSAVNKYNQIVSEQGGSFNGSSSTIQEDIVAMFAAKKGTKRSTPSVTTDTDPDASKTADTEPKKPPFLRHYKHTKASDSPLYKIGDTKEWQGVTYHFCDAPTHRDRVRWHKHPPTKCNVRSRWLEKQQNDADKPAANVADDPSPPADDATQLTEETKDSDVASLLASALVIAPDDNVRNVLNDALSFITDM